MFASKIPVLFVDTNFIEPGVVVLATPPVFEAGQAVAYTAEHMDEVFHQQSIQVGKKNIRIVLAETLVYVTVLSFPRGTVLTRENIRARAEEVIPEDLQKTDWDFRTLGYSEHSKGDSEMLVQVAVIERVFSNYLERAIQSSKMRVESIVPESCLLASFEAHEEGVVVIAEQDRESFLLLAACRGVVLATETKKGELTEGDIEQFLTFLSSRKLEQVTKVFFSRVTDPALVEETERKHGIPSATRLYNPLLGAAYERVTGKDEQILNLNFFAKERWLNRVQKLFRRS